MPIDGVLILAGLAFAAALFAVGYVKESRKTMLVAFALPPLFIIIDLASLGTSDVLADQGPPPLFQEETMQVDYLEIVTPDVDAVCAAYAAAHGVEFSEPKPGLGNARTASLHGGGLVGVRAPLRETEEPIVRPYWLVDDIEAAVAAVGESGAQIAHPPLEIPGHGTFAIYIEGGVEHGLWQR